MMVIKSLSRRSNSFGQLLHYLQKEDRIAGQIIHNLPYLNNQNQAIVKAFQDNAKHLKARKNGVVLYHEILSIHPDDKTQVTNEILKDLAQHYLELRASDALAYGVCHHDQKNPHVHLMISANKIRSPQKLRLSKAKFQRIKQRMQQYIQKHYPALKQTLQSTRDSQQPSRSRKEQGMNTRHRKKQKFSKKDQVKHIVQTALQASSSLADFEEKLQKKCGKTYTRGKQQGVILDKKKYRLKTLGLAELWEQQQEKWARTKQRKKSIQQTFLQKFIREWKTQGFREKMLDVIEEKKSNNRFKELRQIVKWKGKKKILIKRVRQI